jgi:hypothetical protein
MFCFLFKCTYKLSTQTQISAHYLCLLSLSLSLSLSNTHTHKHPRTHAPTHTLTHTSTHAHTRAHTSTRTHTHTHMPQPTILESRPFEGGKIEAGSFHTWPHGLLLTNCMLTES